VRGFSIWNEYILPSSNKPSPNMPVMQTKKMSPLQYFCKTTWPDPGMNHPSIMQKIDFSIIFLSRNDNGNDDSNQEHFMVPCGLSNKQKSPGMQNYP
jgi:hypothetical protein